ncbi:hypothetical protein P691DRAFT_758468 [Macrolepiota fuliginosa MF-IS2]|uniref:Uncharacterized protein n=1 Tax=Macrolepiota fuliginosa MF-IS2 TaxID=1400762 RepID=A0A9P5XG72_9AGAR|nr:hypothetical protein P691DRAFT_758468 [Macrolepiota fuliginosa MF-IS2]
MSFKRFFRPHKPTIEDIEALQDEAALKLIYDHTKQLSKEANEHFRGFFSTHRKSPRPGEQQVRLQQHGNVIMAYDEAGNPCGTLHLPQTVAHTPQEQPTATSGAPNFPNGYVPYPQWKDMHGGPESPLARPEAGEPRNGSEHHPTHLQTSSPSLFWHIPTPPNGLLSPNVLPATFRSFNPAQTPEPGVAAHSQIIGSPSLESAAHSARNDEEVRPISPIAATTQGEASFLSPVNLSTSLPGPPRPYSLQPIPPEPYIPERPWPTASNMFADAGPRSDTTRNNQLSQPNAPPGLPSPSPRRLPMSWLRDRISTRKTDTQSRQGNDYLEEGTPAPARSPSRVTNDAPGTRDQYASNWAALRAWNMTMCILLQNHLGTVDPWDGLREGGNGTSIGTTGVATSVALYIYAHSSLENALRELCTALERGDHTPLRELDNMRG